ncbi:MAG: glycoside hydrolase family 32 protein [Lachnospiraceae bacterium]|nr:glycoside hydrolase family 32 protein [Lachnospiraceae bacterium]
MNALHTAWEKLIEEESRRQKGRTDQDLWRPRLHIAPPAGWLNDPNGLCQYKGIYHAFYQLAYFQPEGGLKFWGHCTSRDLLHWEFQGVPLCPDQPFDCHGAYSGSALIEEDQMYLFYTGNVKLLGEHDYVNTGRESNTVMAVSPDGMQVDTKELLMTNGDYPDDLTRHVRDPKVWKQDGRYYMVLGARTREDEGTVLLFSSEDKKRWNYVHRFRMEKPFGYMWECPDLYVLDGHTVLSISPQGVEQDGLKFANKYQSGTCFLSGDFRETKALGEFRELDGGFDFYAPQTFLADDGRRIQIGWMGMPDMEKVYRNRTVGRGWQNMLTIPRELSVRDGILCQNPVRELKEWWKEERRIKGTYSGPLEPCCELELTTEGGDVKVVLAGGLVLRYEKAEGIFWMEFTDPLLGGGRDIRGRQVGALQELRILVDVSGVEVFLNGGQDVFSTRFYPEKDQYHVEIEGSRVQGVLRYCEG